MLLLSETTKNVLLFCDDPQLQVSTVSLEVDSYNIVFFSRSKICWTLTAGTQPSLTMLMIPEWKMKTPQVIVCKLKPT